MIPEFMCVCVWREAVRLSEAKVGRFSLDEASGDVGVDAGIAIFFFKLCVNTSRRRIATGAALDRRIAGVSNRISCKNIICACLWGHQVAFRSLDA